MIKCRRTSGPYPTQRSTMKAVRFHECGGPEVLTYEDVSAPTPGPGEVVVEIKAVGLNYIDTYHREGLYPVELPCIPGMEAAGVVARVGGAAALLQGMTAHYLAHGSYRLGREDTTLIHAGGWRRGLAADSDG